MQITSIRAMEIELDDQLWIGGAEPAFQWSPVRGIEPCEVAVRLEGGRETMVPGIRVRHGPLAMGIALFINDEAVAVRRLDPEIKKDMDRLLRESRRLAP